MVWRTTLTNNLRFRKRYTVSRLRILCSASYAHRLDKLRQYAEQVLAWYVRRHVSLRVGVFPHLPKGYACALPFFLNSRVLTCDITGENPTTSSGCFWFLVRWPATLPIAGQSSLTSSLLVKTMVGRQLLLLGLVDEQG